MLNWENSPYQRWAKKFVYKNHWKVAHDMGDIEDCMQTCAMLYVWCARRHPEYGEDRLMKFFKAVVFKKWINPSIRSWHHICKTKDYKTLVEVTTQESDPPDRSVNILASASKELRQVLALIGNAPDELLQFMTKSANGAARTNALWNRALGLGSKRRKDLVGELHKLLTE